MQLRPSLKILYILLAASWVVNGAWMLFAPAHWFATIPGASDTGPFNHHLVRDFGVCFLLIGAAALIALARGTFRYTYHAWILAFFALHGAVHVWELMAGYSHSHLWWRAFPWVFGETILLALLSLPGAWRPQAARG
jgi:hypothetical protein